jgi:hypothetical protein
MFDDSFQLRRFDEFFSDFVEGLGKSAETLVADILLGSVTLGETLGSVFERILAAEDAFVVEFA